jgi:hypothetical protein
MGFKLVERVYNLDKKATSPSEQAVLLALAYRANDRTLFCYPKQETLAEMTHLSRSAVARALNTLRMNGLIDWKSGGLANKKGKYGRPLSNDYKLNLPLGKSKIEKISSEPSVLQKDTPVSSCETLQCPGEGHSCVLVEDTAMSCRRTPTVIYNNNLTNNKLNNDTNSRPGGIASGLDFWGESEMPMPLQTTHAANGNPVAAAGRKMQDSTPIHLALSLCDLKPNTPEYRDNYKAFFSIMSKVGMDRSLDILHAIKSEERQGELDGIKNMPAFIMSRLKEFLH